MAERDDIKLPLATPDLTAELLTQLHEAVPQVFSEGKVDFDKLKAALGGQVEQGAERYGLSWAGKSEAFRNVQISSVGTLRPMVDESVHWDDTDNPNVFQICTLRRNPRSKSGRKSVAGCGCPCWRRESAASIRTSIA